MITDKFEVLFGGAAREPESIITNKEMDLAASIQVVTEEIMLMLAKKIKSLTQAENLCLAGGVALNCVANGKLLRSGLFKNIFVQPASGDSGGSLGAAYLCYYKQMQGTRKVDEFSDQMQGAYLGNAYKNSEIQEALNQWGANYQYLEENTLLQKNSRTIGK